MGEGLGEVRMEIDRERRMKRFEHSASHQMSSFLLFYLNSNFLIIYKIVACHCFSNFFLLEMHKVTLFSTTPQSYILKIFL